MKICIVYPPYWHVDNQPGIEPVDSNYGIYPNISLAYVAAVLEKAGHKVKFIDGNALRLTREEILNEVKRFKPDLLAFTITTYLIHQNLSWIRYLKEKTGIPNVVGGVHLSLYPYETFAYKELDYGVIGEAEETIVELVDAIENNKDLYKIDSIIFRDKGKVIKTGNGSIVKDLDNVPFPARHLLPNDKYFEFISQRKNFTVMMTSRGCPFRCIYCEQGKTAFRGRSASNVAGEFEECYNGYKIREVDIFDPMFTTNRKRVLEIAKELTDRKLDVEFAIRSRVDTVDQEMLNALKKAGCSRIYYGIETGNQKIMDKLKKNIKLSQVRNAVKAAKRADIKVLGYFMVGLPGETEKTVLNTINFAKSLDLDYAQFSKVSPLPGTELYNLYLSEFKEDYWRKFVLEQKANRHIGRPQCKIPEEEIQNLVKKAYIEFYFRPNYILKAILRLKSLDEFKRSIKAARDIFMFSVSSAKYGKEGEEYV